MSAPLPLTDDLRGVRLLSITQAADLWGCSRRTIGRLLARGDLRCVYLNADRRIPLTELEAWIARHALLDGRPAPTALPPRANRTTRPA